MSHIMRKRVNPSSASINPYLAIFLFLNMMSAYYAQVYINTFFECKIVNIF